MFRTPKVGTRTLAGIATIATLTGVSLPLMATAASAAVTSVTANPATYQQAAGTPGTPTTVTVTADVARSAGDTTPIRFAIVSGPDADKGANGTLVADGTCTGATTPVSCSFQNTAPGVDVVRIFADTNGNQVIDSGEPTSDATVTLYGPASAVDLKPDSDSAAAGTCNAFTATVTDAGGRAVPGQVVNFDATLTGADAASRTINFCNTTTGAYTTAPAAGPVSTTATTDATGKVTVGIRSDQPGTATLRAYINNNGVGGFQAGEPTDVSNKTFTAGGAGGNSAQDAVSTLSVAPTSQAAVVGDTITYVVTAKNAAGDPTPNVVINRTTTGANPGSSTATTDNNGQATFTYTAANAGSDSTQFFVNQTGGATAGPDASEPKATATATTTAAPSGYTITITCSGTPATTGATKDCINPTSDNNEVFTAFVSKGLTNGQPTPAAGILVRFTTAATNAGTPVVSPTSGVTDASGKVSTTLTDTKEVAGTKDTVTATIAGQTSAQAGGQSADTGSKTWQTPVASKVTLAPALNTTQTGGTSSFVATVTDQFNRPVAGQNVDFYISGRNASLNGPATLNKTTDANGKATLNYTDVGPTNNVTGGNASDTITAVADIDNNDTTQNNPQASATNNFITEPATAGTVDLDVTGAATCGTTTDPANDAASYAPSAATHKVCAVVKTAGGVALTGKTVTFTLSGVGSFATSSTDATATTSPQTVTTDASGVATIYVTSTKSGAQNITATIDGKSDTGTITYTAATQADARNIDLKPNTGDLLNGSNELTALVTDRFGNPVSGIQVDFTEAGPGQFSNGTSSISGTTGATGTVSVTFTSATGTTGTDTVTASIANGFTQCNQPAGQENQTVFPFGTQAAPGATAGNCTDSSTYTLSDKAAGKTPVINILNPVINIGKGGSGVGVTGTPGHTVQLLAYSRPSTTYQVVRTGKFDANGQAVFTVSPRTNTRLFAKDVDANLSSTSGTISVRPALSLVGKATGKVGSFSGTYVPGHGGAAIRLFTVKNGVRSASPVGTATTDAAGHWTFSRTFAATGPVTFIVQSLGDLTNFSGQGNRVTITFS